MLRQQAEPWRRPHRDCRPPARAPSLLPGNAYRGGSACARCVDGRDRVVNGYATTLGHLARRRRKPEARSAGPDITRGLVAAIGADRGRLPDCRGRWIRRRRADSDTRRPRVALAASYDVSIARERPLTTGPDLIAPGVPGPIRNALIPM